MVGKGRRRREKNYRAAHGGNTALPPPPDPSQVDALPSKLRKLISLTSSLGAAKYSKDGETNQKGDFQDDKKRTQNDRIDSKTTRSGVVDGDEHLTMPQHDNDEAVQSKIGKKRKRKAKSGQPEDRRFQAVAEESSTSSRKDRRKMYREARKKKQKKNKDGDNVDFPGRERVRFGDVVQAPPKLAVIPKVPLDASQKRLRLQAIEAYRNRKGWVSRPGGHLPPTLS